MPVTVVLFLLAMIVIPQAPFSVPVFVGLLFLNVFLSRGA